jgi:hypothetical protein
MAGARVVGMTMRDHGALDRAHWIDVEVARLAAETGRCGGEEVLRTHLRYIGGVAALFTSPRWGEVAAPKRSEGVAGEGILLHDGSQPLTR